MFIETSANTESLKARIASSVMSGLFYHTPPPPLLAQRCCSASIPSGIPPWDRVGLLMDGNAEAACYQCLQELCCSSVLIKDTVPGPCHAEICSEGNI
jgi:hypothetical protein